MFSMLYIVSKKMMQKITEYDVLRKYFGTTYRRFIFQFFSSLSLCFSCPVAMSQDVPLPLTPEQLQSWHQNGYLILKNVLSPDEVSGLLQVVDSVIEASERGQTSSRNTKNAHGKEYYNIHNPFDYTDALDYLIDYQKTFDVVTYLMGPYIQTMGCGIFVRRPCCDSLLSNIGKFHTDTGSALQRILPTPENLVLQLKVQFFLTDMQEDNASNFIAIPGSHLKRVTYHHPYCLVPECNQYLEKGELPPGAVQLKVKAGDVLIHALTLWHAVAPNNSPNTRRSISIRYGQMWFKDYHFNDSKHIIERMTPRQKRLCGDFGDNTRLDIAYRPPADHVLLMLGDKAEAFGWSLDWMKEQQA